MTDTAQPFFSIITPTFNSGPKLDSTIQSVLAQDANLFEYIVMDGASTDGTPERLQGYGERLRWKSEPDSGVYDAMNKGLALAQGRYIYFLGAGDVLRPDILSRLAARLPQRPFVFAYGNVQLHTFHKKFNGRYNRWKLSRVNICHQSLFCTRDLFARVGVFDLRYPVLSDYVFNLRCYRHADILKIYLNEVIADFEEGGLSARLRDARFLADRLVLFRENLGFGPYALNKAISLLPAGWKEARHQAFHRWKVRRAQRKGE